MAELKLDYLLQESLVTLVCYEDSPEANAIRTTLSPSSFDPYYKQIFEEADRYRIKFGKAPGEHTLDLINSLCERQPDNKTQYKRIFQSMLDSKDGMNREYLLDKAHLFSRYQKIKAVAAAALSKLEEDTSETAITEAEVLMSNVAKGVNGQMTAGIFLHNPKDSLRFLDKDENNIFRFGIPELDAFKIGPTRKKYMLISGATNSGKCVTKHCRIWTPKHGYLRMEQVGEKRPSVFGVDQQTNAVLQTKVTDYFKSGEKSIVEIGLKSGRVIRELADTHPVLTWEGYVPAGNLQAGDLVLAAAKLPLIGQATKKEIDEIYVAGVFVGDGCLVAKNGPRLSQAIDEVSVVQFVCKVWGVGPPYRQQKQGGFDYEFPKSCFSFLDKWDLRRSKSKSKFVPTKIYEKGEEAICAFLAGLFDTDGSVYTTIAGTHIEYCTASYRLSEDILIMLNVVGIYAHRRRKDVTLDGKQFKAWVIELRDSESINIFVRRVVHYSHNQKKRLRCWKRKTTPNWKRGNYYKRVPAVKIIDDLDPAKTTARQRVYLKRLVRQRNRVNLDEARGVVKNPDKLQGQFAFDEVRYVKIVGREKCFDISTEEKTQSFLAEHVFTHNSWSGVHLDKTALVDGRRVMHITLEMSEDDVMQRVIQSLFSIGTRDAKYVMKRLQKDELGRFMGIEEETIKRPYFKKDGIRDYLVKKLQPYKQRPRFVVKEYPSGTLNIRMLKGYLDFMESVHEFIPDLLVIDYPDLMDHDAKNKRTELEKITVDIRGIAAERNIAAVGFSQVVEKGGKNSLVMTGRAYESRGKEHAADISISINQTNEEYELGLMRLFVNKSRAEKKFIQVLITQQLELGQFCMDSCPILSNYWNIIGAAGEKEDAESEEDDE